MDNVTVSPLPFRPIIESPTQHVKLRVTDRRVFVWASTKQKFRYQTDAYVVEHDIPGFLPLLVVRRALARNRTGEQQAEASVGRYRRALGWVLHAEYVGVFKGIPAQKRRADLELVAIPRHSFAASMPSCFDSARFDAITTERAAYPIASVAPRVVLMPDGYYAVAGEAFGPFPTKQVAQAALRVAAGDDT